LNLKNLKFSSKCISKMGFFGNLLGQALGGGAGGLFGHRDTGAQIGGTLGNLLPFKKGGKVPVILPNGMPVMVQATKAKKKGGKRKAETQAQMNKRMAKVRAAKRK